MIDPSTEAELLPSEIDIISVKARNEILRHLIKMHILHVDRSWF